MRTADASDFIRSRSDFGSNGVSDFMLGHLGIDCKMRPDCREWGMKCGLFGADNACMS